MGEGCNHAAAQTPKMSVVYPVRGTWLTTEWRMAAYPSDASFKSLMLLSAALCRHSRLGSITPVKNIPWRGKMGCLVELLWHWDGERERDAQCDRRRPSKEELLSFCGSFVRLSVRLTTSIRPLNLAATAPSAKYTPRPRLPNRACCSAFLDMYRVTHDQDYKILLLTKF